MMLLTKEIRAKLPALYSQEDKGDEAMVYLKLFFPMGRGTWYATEFDGEDTFFGYCVSPLGSDCDELGYFSLSEMEALVGPMGLKMERDLHFTPSTLGEVKAKHP